MNIFLTTGHSTVVIDFWSVENKTTNDKGESVKREVIQIKVGQVTIPNDRNESGFIRSSCYHSRSSDQKCMVISPVFTGDMRRRWVELGTHDGYRCVYVNPNIPHDTLHSLRQKFEVLERNIHQVIQWFRQEDGVNGWHLDSEDRLWNHDNTVMYQYK